MHACHAGCFAPIGKKAKGIPIWSLWVLLAVGVAGIWWSSKFVPRLMEAGLGVGQKTGSKLVKPMAPVAAVHPVEPPAGDFAEAPAPVSRPSKGQRPAEPLRVSGYVVRGAKVNVVLTDGRTFTEQDKELQRVARNSVTIDGQKYFMA